MAIDKDRRCLTRRETWVVLPHLSTPSRRMNAPRFGMDVELVGVIIAIEFLCRLTVEIDSTMRHTICVGPSWWHAQNEGIEWV